MISTFLVEHPWLSPAALVLLVVVGLPAGVWMSTRPRTARWLTALSLLPLAALTLSPSSRRSEVGCTVEWYVPTPGAVEGMANLVLFVAPVMLLAVAWHRPAASLVVGSATSVAIEIVQAVAPGLGRSCSTNDWLTNSLGAALGALLAASALAVARRRPGVEHA